MADWVVRVMEQGGYLAVFLLMVLENLFPPLPSEVVLPAAGFAAARGTLELPLVILCGALGSVIGTLPLYALGRAWGEERAAAWADRWGRWLMVSGHDVRATGTWFSRHGEKAVLLGRMVPGVRSLLSLPAGVAAMPLPRFLVYSLVGSALWSAVLAGAGYGLGRNFERVAAVVGPAGSGVLAALALAASLLWWRRRQARRALG